MQKIMTFCDNCGIEVINAFQCYAVLKYNRSITGELLGHDAFAIDLCKGCTRNRFEALCANLALYVSEENMKHYAGLISKNLDQGQQSAGCTVGTEINSKKEKEKPRKYFDMD